MTDLHRYIAELSSLASAGEGRFTIDPVRQRRLLAEFGLDEARLGLLKLAQAAVLSASSSLTFQSGKELLVRFDIPAPLATPWWDTIAVGDDEWQTCIALGMLALSQEFDLEWSWKFAAEGGNGRVSDAEFTQANYALQNPAHHAFVCRLKLKRPGLWHLFGNWASGLARWLAPRLAWMPIPVSWDGKYLNKLLGGGKLIDGKEFRGGGSLSRSAEAFVYCGEDEPGDLWLPSRSLAQYSSSRCTHSPDGDPRPALVAITADGRPVYRGIAVLGQHNGDASEMTFIRHGVALETESGLLGYRAIAFISAAGLQTDLTGLKLIRNTAFKTRLRSLRPEKMWMERHNFRPTE